MEQFSGLRDFVFNYIFPTYLRSNQRRKLQAPASGYKGPTTNTTKVNSLNYVAASELHTHSMVKGKNNWLRRFKHNLDQLCSSFSRLFRLFWVLWISKGDSEHDLSKASVKGGSYNLKSNRASPNVTICKVNFKTVLKNYLLYLWMRKHLLSQEALSSLPSQTFPIR